MQSGLAELKMLKTVPANSTCLSSPSNSQGYRKKWSANLFDYIYAWASAWGHGKVPVTFDDSTQTCGWHFAEISLFFEENTCILKNHWTTLSLSFVIYIWCWNLSSAVTITFFLRFLTYNLYKGYCFPLKHHLKPYAEGKKCVNLKSDILPIFFQLIRNNPDQETTTRFQVGSSFSGEQTLGGAFTAMASWIEARSGLTWPRGFSL